MNDKLVIHHGKELSDSSNRVVVIDSAMTPATFWVKLADLDFKPGTPVKKLTLTGGKHPAAMLWTVR